MSLRSHSAWYSRRVTSPGNHRVHVISNGSFATPQGQPSTEPSHRFQVLRANPESAGFAVAVCRPPKKLNSALAAFFFGLLGSLATQCHLIDAEPHLILGAAKFPKSHFDCLDRRQ